MNYKSGYDPTTGICWQFHNKGDQSHLFCKCPTHSDSSHRTLAWFGRCRSGKRWFWAAGVYFSSTSEGVYFSSTSETRSGWTDNEEQAMAAAIAAVRACKTELPMIAAVSHGVASDELKKLNEAKRRARPAPDTSDTHAVEYLFGYSHIRDDRCLYRFRITRKTAKRIFYIRPGERLDESGDPDPYPFSYRAPEKVGYVNRQKLERDGEVYNEGVHWCREDHHLHISLQHLLASFWRGDEPDCVDLKALKAAAAAAHPDRGGSHAAFIKAYAAYEAAYKAARRTHLEAKRRARS
jgi:hypothetical protein